jgi:hypothetical protein
VREPFRGSGKSTSEGRQDGAFSERVLSKTNGLRFDDVVDYDITGTSFYTSFYTRGFMFSNLDAASITYSRAIYHYASVLFAYYATHNYHRSQEYTTHWVVIYKELHQPYQGRGFIMSSSGNNILIRKAACADRYHLPPTGHFHHPDFVSAGA